MDSLSHRPDVETGPAAIADGAADGAACAADDIGLGARQESTADAFGKRPTQLFAVTTLDFGIDASAPPPGLNLDGVISTDRSLSSCSLAVDLTKTESYVLDRPDGVDNAAAALIQALGGVVLNMQPASIQDRLAAGRFGLLIQLADWNGEPNDSTVLVEVFPTIGYSRIDGGTETPQPESGEPPHDELGDRLTPDGRFQGLSKGSLLTTGDAWVSQGRLIARFATLTIPIRSSVDDLRSFDYQLHDAWVTAVLRTDAVDGGLSRLEEGAIVGRLGASDLFAQVKLLHDDSGYLCENKGPVRASAILPVVCAARDIRMSHCEDRVGLPCDSFSFGVRFEARPVDGMASFRTRTDEEYHDAGQLPPGERCHETDAEASSCP
jgi:hypothetical protein